MRIIGGELGGRHIRAPRGAKTRPTSDRVREAVFNILGSPPKSVLDLYCGSGALAFEALSRGAQMATLVDRDLDAWNAATANAKELGLTERVRIFKDSVERMLRAHAAAYDWIFADPPYADESALILPLVEPRLAPGGILIVEHDKFGPPPERSGTLALTSRRRYGDTEVSFYQVSA